jgi:hypothetical protein
MHTDSYFDYDRSTGSLLGTDSVLTLDSFDSQVDLRIKSSNPDHELDRLKGFDITLPYERTVVKFRSFSPGSSVIDSPSLPFIRKQFGFDAGLPVLYPMDLIDLDRLDSETYIKLILKVREQIVAFSAPTFIGELADTIRLLKHPTLALRQSLESFTKAAKSLPKGKSLAQLWLEYSFGWSPLIADVSSAMSALERLHTVTKPIIVRATSNVPIHESLEYTGGTYSTNTRTFCSYDGTFGVRYYGSFLRRKSSTFSADMALFGFDWSELVPAAWELIPWSFLVDYFTNIGDAIEANVTLGQVYKVFLGKSYRGVLNSSAVSILDAAAPDSSFVSSFVPQSEELLVTQFLRSGPLEQMFATPSVHIPGRSGFKRLLNLSALLALRK